jgi:hypothetical protein
MPAGVVMNGYLTYYTAVVVISYFVERLAVIYRP